MHRTGVNRALRCGARRFGLAWSNVRLRTRAKLSHAFRAAEMVGRSFVRDFLLRVSGHLHPAYGVGKWLLRIRGRMVMGRRIFMLMNAPIGMNVVV